MGDGFVEYDNFIPGFFDMLNLRFAPPPNPTQDEWVGGIEEMTALQKEFQIFQEGRSFKDSVRILNLDGLWNWGAKNRYYKVLEYWGGCPIEQTGDQRIVRALVSDLALPQPWPVHFTSHEWGTAPQVRVIGDSNDRNTLTKPLFYMDQLYIVISFPMRPQTTAQTRARGRRTTRPRR
jgi:hypothetical protein